jgi:hypothetical protein
MVMHNENIVTRKGTSIIGLHLRLSPLINLNYTPVTPANTMPTEWPCQNYPPTPLAGPTRTLNRKKYPPPHQKLGAPRRNQRGHPDSPQNKTHQREQIVPLNLTTTQSASRDQSMEEDDDTSEISSQRYSTPIEQDRDEDPDPDYLTTQLFNLLFAVQDNINELKKEGRLELDYGYPV